MSRIAQSVSGETVLKRVLITVIGCCVLAAVGVIGTLAYLFDDSPTSLDPRPFESMAIPTTWKIEPISGSLPEGFHLGARYVYRLNLPYAEVIGALTRLNPKVHAQSESDFTVFQLRHDHFVRVSPIDGGVQIVDEWSF